MRQQKRSFILILTILLGVADGGQAETLCAPFFEKAQAPLIEIQPPIPARKISVIQNKEWIFKKLFDEGWAQKISSADFSRDHIELFEFMISEKLKIMEQDLGGMAPLQRLTREFVHLNRTERAKQKLREKIYLDLKESFRIKKENKDITTRYFVETGGVLAAFFALKDPEVQYEGVQSYSANEARQKVIAENVESILRQHRMAVVPMFAELDVFDFVKLGLDVAPLGQTIEHTVVFDGLVKGRSSFTFYLHDMTHFRNIANAISKIRLEKGESAVEEIKRVLRFLKTSERFLSPEERIVVGLALFEIFHEIPDFMTDLPIIIKTGSYLGTRFNLDNLYRKIGDKAFYPEYRTLADKKTYGEGLNRVFQKLATMYNESSKNKDVSTNRP